MKMFGSFPVLLHYTLDVGSFGRGEDWFVLLRSEMDNCINGSPEDFACLIENVSKQIQNIPAWFQRTLQQADCLVFFFCGLEHRHVDAVLFPGPLLLKLPDSLVPLHAEWTVLRQSPVTFGFDFLLLVLPSILFVFPFDIQYSTHISRECKGVSYLYR